MSRPRSFAILLEAAAAVVAVGVVRHGCGGMGRRVPGGILIGDAALYDALGHRLLLGSLLDRIAADVAVVVPESARVLEVGCGPGRLSIRLARRYGLDVTGLDLDPAMIERARANAERSRDGDERRPEFIVGDVASLAFPDGSFDLVVSTLSMHHWADPTAGLAEIGRVLPGRSCARVGLPGRPRAAARTTARSGRAGERVSASLGRRSAMALAVAVRPSSTDRARARRRRAPPRGSVDPGPTRRPRRAISPRYREVRCSTPSSSRSRLPWRPWASED
jgi:SAM-dependent methyltransferase